MNGAVGVGSTVSDTEGKSRVIISVAEGGVQALDDVLKKGALHKMGTAYTSRKQKCTYDDKVLPLAKQGDSTEKQQNNNISKKVFFSKLRFRKTSNNVNAIHSLRFQTKVRRNQ